VNARVAGAVLNGVDRRRDQYYTYYSQRKERQPQTSVKTLISRMF
jgi:hypothetical protein